MLGFVAEKAQPQAAFPLKRSVTSAGVAPRPAKKADDVALEIHWSAIVHFGAGWGARKQLLLPWPVSRGGRREPMPAR